MSNRARVVRVLLVALVLVCAPGCVWLQNEFFVFDAPPPATEVPAGTTSGH